MYRFIRLINLLSSHFHIISLPFRSSKFSTSSPLSFFKSFLLKDQKVNLYMYLPVCMYIASPKY
jgi:hypothetical protein